MAFRYDFRSAVAGFSLSLCACAALAGCGGIAVIDGGSGAGAGGGTGGSGAGGDGGLGQDCFEITELQEDEQAPFLTCAPPPCSVLVVTDSQVGQDTFDQPEVATCILTQLRDRTPGMILIIAQNGGLEQIRQSTLHGDEFGIHEQLDLPGPDAPLPMFYRRSRRLKLKSPEFFEDCLNNSITGQVWASCLSEWWTGCTDEPGSCEP